MAARRNDNARGRVTVFDDQGYPHRGVAVYALVAEPVQEVV